MMLKYPLIKFTLLLIIGLILQRLFFFQFSFLLVLISCLVILIICFAVVVKYYKYSSGWSYIIINILLFMAIVGSGMTLLSSSNQHSIEYPFDDPRILSAKVFGIIKNIELSSNGNNEFLLKADSIFFDERKVIGHFLLLSKVKEDKKSKSNPGISIGNKIFVTGIIQKGRERRNPFEFDYNNYLNSIGVTALLYISSATDISVVDSSTSIIENTINNVRNMISSKLTSIHSDEASALLKGLILADRSGIDYDKKEDFVNAGVIHVLAVSGLHVGFIALIFLFLFGRMNVYLRYTLTILGLLSFMLLTGSPPSVFRATTMAVVMLLLLISKRTYNNFNALSLAALIILILDPNELFNPGFQLSFSAVLSILIFYPKFKILIQNRNLKFEWIKNLMLFISVSLAAQVGTLPFTLIYFNKLSIVSLVANLVVIPLIGIILGLGFIELFSSAFSVWIAKMYAETNELIVSFLFNFTNYLSDLSFSHLFIEQFSFFDAALFYLLLVLTFIYWKKITSLNAKAIFLSLLFLNAFIYEKLDNEKLLPDNILSIVMIDVGQGDSFLIKFPNKQIALVDAGDATKNFDNGQRIILPLLKNLGITSTDYGFISHVDSDHYKGFEFLIKNGIVKNIYKPKIDRSQSKDVDLEELIKSMDVPIHYYSYEIKEIGNVRMYILNDTLNTSYNEMDSNNKSGILKMYFGNKCFLFVGDAETPAEKLLTGKYKNFLKSDVLKIGHHGSKTSSSNSFIDYVNPSVGLISAGMFNKFNHPSKEIVKRYNDRNIILKRTDKEGAVILHTDGNRIWFTNWR